MPDTTTAHQKILSEREIKKVKSFSIQQRDAGQRLDKYLHRILPEATSGFLHKMLRKKNILWNDKRAEGREILQAGDQVQLYFSEETFAKFSGKTGTASSINKETEQYISAYGKIAGITVIYEDEDLIFLNKPAGVLSQKSTGDDISLNEWMIGYLLKTKSITEESLSMYHPSVCNRLDRNTSGCILCGKTLQGSRFLNQLLQERSLHKYYLTFVSGEIEAEGYLSGYLRKNEITNKVKIVQEISESDAQNYDKIETSYRPLCYHSESDVTELEVLLITGKSHQIRAHFAFIHHPLIGDVKYGGPIMKNMPAYQLLHAYRIVFPEMEGYFSYLSGKEWTAPKPGLFKKMEAKLCPHGIPEA